MMSGAKEKYLKSPSPLVQSRTNLELKDNKLVTGIMRVFWWHLFQILPVSFTPILDGHFCWVCNLFFLVPEDIISLSFGFHREVTCQFDCSLFVFFFFLVILKVFSLPLVFCRFTMSRSGFCFNYSAWNLLNLKINVFLVLKKSQALVLQIIVLSYLSLLLKLQLDVS